MGPIFQIIRERLGTVDRVDSDGQKVRMKLREQVLEREWSAVKVNRGHDTIAKYLTATFVWDAHTGEKCVQQKSESATLTTTHAISPYADQRRQIIDRWEKTWQHEGSLLKFAESSCVD